MEQVQSLPRFARLAAKTNPLDDEQWLPLWMHSRDTAEMMRRLIQIWVPDSIRTTIALEEDTLYKLAYFLGATHDIGKATFLFQSTICSNLPQVRARLNCFLDIPNIPIAINRQKTPHARAGEAILLKQKCPAGIASIIGAHHGKPQANTLDDYVEDQMELYPYHYWGRGQKGQWQNLWEGFLHDALKRAGFSSMNELPALTIPTEILLTGLLIMADWIASNTHYFPLISVEEMGEEALYPARVDRAWERVAFTSPWIAERSAMDVQSFQTRFGFMPNDIQRAVLDIVNQTETPGLLMVEAQMGAGKTEAALAAAEVFAGKFNEGGLYIGLPTQATANGMFGRLKRWAQGQSEETAHSIRLAHGMAELNENYRALFSGAAFTQEDDPESGVFVHDWFAGNKQALLADFVVGTVDQLLLAAFKQRHLMLRHLGLAGKVVIVDEVHAYDAYMNQYLDQALIWLGKYRVPVILLSATLPAKRRTELVEAYLGNKQETTTWKKNPAYPLLTWTDGAQVLQTAVPIHTAQHRVVIRKSNERALPDILRDCLADGGCAGVIVNTVQKAQAIAASLRQTLTDMEIVLFHAQFVMPDRAAKERMLLERLGKDATPTQRNKLIVVGTQVLEQSLDIDFDFLISELCPMDLLLQRIGRQHRHTGRSRPARLQKACCVVLDTDDDRFDPGSKAVYGQWLLWRTRKLLPACMTLPTDIARLVQATYDWEERDCLPINAESRQMRQEYETLQQKKARRAAQYTILPPEEHPYFPNRNVLDNWLRDEGARSDAAARAAVRDGDPSIEVLVMMQKDDGTIHFLPWQEEGRAVAADRPPCAEESVRIARQKLRLPAYFSRKWNIDDVIRELEERNRRDLPEWQEACLLKGELILLLDANMTTHLAGTILRYDREDGLTYRKEETDEGSGV